MLALLYPFTKEARQLCPVFAVEMRTALSVVFRSLKLNLLVDVSALEAPVQERPRVAAQWQIG